MRFTERLDEIGARPSIGTAADSFDNALAETTNGLYKTECVYGPDAAGWDDVDEVELATLSGCTGSTSTGSTATAATCRQRSSKGPSTLPNRPTPEGLEPNSPSLHQTQGGSGAPSSACSRRHRRISDARKRRWPPRVRMG